MTLPTNTCGTCGGERFVKEGLTDSTVFCPDCGTATPSAEDVLTEHARCIVTGARWCAGGPADRRHPECVLATIRSLPIEQRNALIGQEQVGRWVRRMDGSWGYEPGTDCRWRQHCHPVFAPTQDKEGDQ